MPLGDIPASPSRNCSTSFDYTSSSPLGRLGTSDTGLVLLRHYAQHESQQRLHHQVRTEKQGRPQALRERLPKTSTEDLYAVSLRLVPLRTYYDLIRQHRRPLGIVNAMLFVRFAVSSK